MSHTPTPWSMEVAHIEGSQRPFVHIDHKPSEFELKGICTLSLDNCVENAAFIVKAVNAHDDLVAALKAIIELEERPFEGYPADWHVQIEECADCQSYKGHPIQQGICNTHRQPIYASERHHSFEQGALGYRAKDIARAALTKAGAL